MPCDVVQITTMPRSIKFSITRLGSVKVQKHANSYYIDGASMLDRLEIIVPSRDTLAEQYVVVRNSSAFSISFDPASTGSKFHFRLNKRLANSKQHVSLITEQKYAHCPNEQYMMGMKACLQNTCVGHERN